VAKDLDKDVKGQTKEIVDEIDRLLAKCGSGKTKLLSALIWLTDIRNRAPMNEVWTAWVDPKNMPARACVEAKLADPNALVGSWSSPRSDTRERSVSADLDAIFERNYARVEPYTLLMMAQVRSIFDRLVEVRELPGDCIEFGAFRGGLSFFLGLCIVDMGLAKRVAMLDSFQGLPPPDEALDAPFEQGTMASDLQEVLRVRAELGSTPW